MSGNIYRKFGAMPSPKDDRDYKISRLIAKLPAVPELYECPIKAPILDQGISSQCVACSLATVRYITEYCQSGSMEGFSTSYIYGNRREDDYLGEGMYPREALKTLLKFGVPKREFMPGFMSFGDAAARYETEKDRLDKAAHPYRISSYYAVDGADEIKAAVVSMGAVSGMFPVFRCLYEPGENGIVEYDKPSKIYGYHQMTIVGYKPGYWHVQNSWGTEWGENGYCWLPMAYPINEAWVEVDDIIEAALK